MSDSTSAVNSGRPAQHVRLFPLTEQMRREGPSDETGELLRRLLSRRVEISVLKLLRNRERTAAVRRRADEKLSVQHIPFAVQIAALDRIRRRLPLDFGQCPDRKSVDGAQRKPQRQIVGHIPTAAEMLYDARAVDVVRCHMRKPAEIMGLHTVPAAAVMPAVVLITANGIRPLRRFYVGKMTFLQDPANLPFKSVRHRVDLLPEDQVQLGLFVAEGIGQIILLMRFDERSDGIAEHRQKRGINRVRLLHLRTVDSTALSA